MSFDVFQLVAINFWYSYIKIQSLTFQIQRLAFSVPIYEQKWK